MAFLSKYGTLWGQTPRTTGRVFFVAAGSPYYIDGRAYDASDSVNDGLSPERALSTVARALVLAAVSSGNPIDSGGSIATRATTDTIILLPGTHTATALLRITSAGVTISGLPNAVEMDGPYPGFTHTILTTSASEHLISPEASNITIANLTLRPITLFSAVVFRNNPTVDNLRFKNVVVDLHTPVAGTEMVGFDFAYRSDSSTISSNSYSTKAGNVAATAVVRATAYLEGVTILARDGMGRGIEQATASLTLRNVWFKHTSNGTWATPYHVATGSVQSYMEDCRFTTGGTLTTCVNAAGASATNALTVRKVLFATTTASSPMCYAAANVVKASEAFIPDVKAASVGLGQSIMHSWVSVTTI